MTGKTAHFPEGARKPAGAYSPVIRIGQFVYASGQVAADPVTGELRGDSIDEQTTAVLDNLERVLGAAGAGLTDVVKTTVFLTNATDFSGMDAAYRRRFGEVFPARSAVTVAGLARPGLLVEIDAVAAVAD
jgi:2-iminobutanoate/2-iminopropanoate deaminase